MGAVGVPVALDRARRQHELGGPAQPHTVLGAWSPPLASSPALPAPQTCTVPGGMLHSSDGTHGIWEKCHGANPEDRPSLLATRAAARAQHAPPLSCSTAAVTCA
jgi:hypothetical protein